MNTDSTPFMDEQKIISKLQAHARKESLADDEDDDEDDKLILEEEDDIYFEHPGHII